MSPQTKDVKLGERHPFLVALDDDVKEKLRERARKNHRSMSGEVRAILDEVVGDDES